MECYSRDLLTYIFNTVNLIAASSVENLAFCYRLAYGLYNYVTRFFLENLLEDMRTYRNGKDGPNSAALGIIEVPLLCLSFDSG